MEMPEDINIVKRTFLRLAIRQRDKNLIRVKMLLSILSKKMTLVAKCVLLVQPSL